MNEHGFVIAGDGWVQVTPCGEYPHKGAGVTQVIDRAACDAMVADFNARKAEENFPGLLVDFDHFSLDTDKPSEAAGWISEVETRDDGLWARVRWSDAGLSAVTGGRYRLLSPVFRHPGGTEDLGGGRVRPVVLESVALTNEPNIKGGKPLANRQTAVGNGANADGLNNRETAGEGPVVKEGKGPVGKQSPGDVIGGPGAKRFMWLLGNPPKGPHCADCVSRHGQVKTLLEWLRMPAPKCRCCCRLAEVGRDVPDDYVAPAIMTPAAEEGDAVENRWAKPWGDKARAASLAVRRAKAAAREASPGGIYPDGQPVIRDLTDLPGPSTGTTISDAGEMEARQAAYAEAFRNWLDGVDEVAGSIEGFNEFVASAGGAVAAVAGASAPAGAASRAFGVGGTRTGSARARRGGAFSRITGGVREWFNGKPGELPAYERAKAVFAQRRAVEKAALLEAVRKAKGVLAENEGKDPNGLNASILRGYLREIGGNPDEVAPRHRLVKTAPVDTEGRTGFEGLKARYGLKPEEIKTPEKYAPKVTAARVREEFADYLLETLGGRRGNVDQNLRELETFRRETSRAVARAKAHIRDAQHTVSEAKRVNGAGSPEYAKSLKAAEEAVWEHAHASRVNDEVSREYVQLKRNIDDYLRSVNEGSPFDWGPVDRDYNRLLEEARQRAGTLGNRWKYGWGDAARAASLAVRKAKAAARKADAALSEFLTGGLVAGEKPGEKKGACYVCGQAGHYAAECPQKVARTPKKLTPHLNADGDLVVDDTLTIMRGTSSEQIAKILKRHTAGWLLDDVIAFDQRMRAIGAEKARVKADAPETATAKPKGVKKMFKAKRSAAGSLLITNRWYTHWGDKARAASLAVRRAKAAARAAAASSSLGGTYADGQPVIRDMTDIGSDYTGGLYYSTPDPDYAARQAAYAAALRDAWESSNEVAGKIEAFNAIVASLGGAMAAAGGAARPAGAATGLFGASSRRYGGQKPVTDESGGVQGWAKVGRAPYGRASAARRGTRPAREPYGSDPLNDPKTPADLAVRESYTRHLENLRRQHESEMAAKGLDPQGYPLSSGRVSDKLDRIIPAAREAKGLFEALRRMDPATFEQRDLYESAREGLSRFTDLFEQDMLERAEKEGLLPRVREAVEEYNRLRAGGTSTRETGSGYPAEDRPYFASPSSNVKEPAASYGMLSAGAARDAARALGVLHGAYGVGEDGVVIPEVLQGDYELGRVEGAKGYDYGIVTPKDRAAVLRGARAYLDGAVGDDEGYAPDHLNDRYNLEKWESSAKWAARNLDGKGVYDPRSPDTRGQYNPVSLMGTAMEWFKDAMVRGDRGESNAALSYMGDMLVALSSDRKAAVEATRGGPDESADDDDAVEADATMPEYDADGVEVGGEPFFEDSYADPNARMPWEWLGNRALPNAGHSAACAAARSPHSECSCSCGGALHGGRDAGYKTVAKEVLFGGLPEAVKAAGLKKSPDTQEEWSKFAAEQFEKKYGRAPANGADWSLAESEAQVPPALRQYPILEDKAAGVAAGGGNVAQKKARSRKARQDANEARKALAKQALQEARNERAAARNAPLEKKFNAPGLREKFKAPGLREKFAKAEQAVDRDRLKDKSLKGVSFGAAEGFSVPDKGALYYFNGNFYDSKGRWVAKTKPSPKSGAVFQNGMWYDAATGRTLGGTVANREDFEGRLLANVGWTDVARAASLAVRRAKAALRAAVAPAGVDDPLRIRGVQKPAVSIPKPVPSWKKRKGREPAGKYPWHIFGGLVNRWSDEARAASIAVRQAKAAARVSAPVPHPVAAGGVTASGSPVGFAPPSGSPPREGTIVNAGGGISIMSNGRLVRIGSAKVLCVLPDGQLGLKRGGKAYPLGKPAEWGSGMSRLKIYSTWDGKLLLDCGKGLLSLEDGKVRQYPGQPKTGTKGTVAIQRGYDLFSQGGVPIPPDPPDISRRRDIQV